VLVSGGPSGLRDLVTGRGISGEEVVHRSFGRRDPGQEDPRCGFTVHLMPHSYRVFASEPATAEPR
jgi:hypothetical protein